MIPNVVTGSLSLHCNPIAIITTIWVLKYKGKGDNEYTNYAKLLSLFSYTHTHIVCSETEASKHCA